MKPLWLLVVSIVWVAASSAQTDQIQKEVDSLLLELTKVNEDTARIQKLIDLSSTYRYIEPDSGVHYGKVALAEAGKLGRYKYLASAHMHMGDIYKDVGQFENSLGHYQQALSSYEDHNDTLGIGNCYNNLSVLYQWQDRNDKSIELQRKAMIIYEQLDDSFGLAMGHNNIGTSFESMDELDSALRYYENSYEIVEALGLEEGMAVLGNNIGLILGRQGHNAEALEYYQRGRRYSAKLGMWDLNVVCLMNMASVYERIGNRKKALEISMESITIARKMQYRKVLLTGLVGRSKLLERAGDYQGAYRFHKEYTSLKDSMLNEESAEQIAEMEAKYESEKKEKEIELLGKTSELQETRLAQNQTVLWVSGIGLGLVLFLAVFILAGLVQKRRTNQLLAVRNNEVTQQKMVIEGKNKDILDSIKYAKRIQEAILPPDQLVKDHLKESFILYKPKDIVSGDFYWMDTLAGSGDSHPAVLFAAVDCTGHGVPGAFMSIVGHNALNQAVNEYDITEPGKILDFINEAVQDTLRQREEQTGVKDGMDMALCRLERSGDGHQLQYAGAHNPLWLVRKGELLETKADKQAIGAANSEYINHTIQLESGDTVYIFSDGYVDQFGGGKGKKLKSKAFKQLLLGQQERSMASQSEAISKYFEDWKGDLEQVDDVCVIGVRV